MSDIETRKTDHIDLALKSEHQSQADSSFDRIRFEHNALPELALSEINLERNLTEEEFNKKKTNFNMPSLFKLFASYYAYNEIQKKVNKNQSNE